MSQRNTDFSIIASDSTEDKSSALNVKTSLKESFLCALVIVERSGKYLNDKTASKQQARVTLQYRTTTTYEQLSLSHLGRHNVTHPDVFDQGTATQVVTAILYGAQAFFVFDRMIEVSGQGSVHIKEQDKLQTNNFSFNFHGDFALPSNPTTFEDAIKIYTNLPKMIGENGEHSAPIRVWLYPLNLLDNKAAKLVRNISIGLVDCSQAVLEDLDDFDRQCNDLINHKTANQFPETGQKIKQFKSMYQRYKFFFQSKLAQLLPLTHGTGKQESLLANLLSTKEKSPFSKHLLTTWLEEKKREINIVKSYSSRMEEKDRKVASSSSELDSLIFDFRVIKMFCFMFTSLKHHDPYLADLTNYLKSSNDETQFQPLSCDPGETVKHRVEYRKVSEEVWIQVDREDKNECLTVSALCPKTQYQFRYVVCVHGENVTSDLINSKTLPTSPPGQPLIDQLEPSSISIIRDKLTAIGEQVKIQSYTVQYRDEGEEATDDNTATWAEKSTQDEACQCTIMGVKPNTHYRIRVSSNCGEAGTSAPSDEVTILTPIKRDASILATRLIEQSSLLEKGEPSVYKLPVTEVLDENIHCQRFIFGKTEEKRLNKVIMIIGATESETSTVINGMINYILGVDWEDKYRFKLVTKEMMCSQQKSKTSAVSVYEIIYQTRI
nr:PREDICTED: stonustoxin subunit alpha-like [Latimeria chalumnae]|eukprot:XP_014352501.1 PREDICTED: stonustoxin subunit alpha-like [Latimeria chalumnae]